MEFYKNSTELTWRSTSLHSQLINELSTLRAWLRPTCARWRKCSLNLNKRSSRRSFRSITDFKWILIYLQMLLKLYMNDECHVVFGTSAACAFQPSTPRALMQLIGKSSLGNLTHSVINHDARPAPRTQWKPDCSLDTAMIQTGIYADYCCLQNYYKGSFHLARK